MINAAQDTDCSIKSCYKTLQAEWADPNNFVLGIDLGDSYFAHAVMLITDTDVMPASQEKVILENYTDTKDWLQNVEVFVGDSINF